MVAKASTHHSTDLASVLQTAGVELTRVNERELTGRCPVHVRTIGREDKSPSWSMNASSGLWICFSCGARGTLSALLREMSGDDSISAQQFLINAGMQRLTASSDGVEDVPVLVDRDAFFQFERVSNKRCHGRNLDPEIVYRFGVRWNQRNKSWAIPIISPLGQLQGWQEKKPGWVRNFPVGVKKGQTLFGVERVRSTTIILVESPLDVVRFAGVFDKPNAVASFGATVSSEQIRLLTHVADRVVVAMDNDEAGAAASKYIYKAMDTPRRGVRWWNYNGCSAKDIGEMTDDEIERGLATATVIPPWVA